MKKIVFILLSMLIISCSSDDDDSGISQRLSGEWYLTSADCYCSFDPEVDFENYTLQFEDSKNVLRLNSPSETNYFIAEPGSYNYRLEGDIIKINGAESYRYEFRDSNLILTKIDAPEIADDELVLTYMEKK